MTTYPFNFNVDNEIELISVSEYGENSNYDTEFLDSIVRTGSIRQLLLAIELRILTKGKDFAWMDEKNIDDGTFGNANLYAFKITDGEAGFNKVHSITVKGDAAFLTFEDGLTEEERKHYTLGEPLRIPLPYVRHAGIIGVWEKPDEN